MRLWERICKDIKQKCYFILLVNGDVREESQKKKQESKGRLKMQKKMELVVKRLQFNLFSNFAK